MSDSSVEIRTYEIQADGSLSSSFDTDISYYGACPVVGDTVCRWSYLHEKAEFFEVIRRYFVRPHDGPSGWTIVLKQLEVGAEMKSVYDEWVASSRFWRNVDEQHEEEERQKLRARLVAGQKKKPAAKPRKAQSEPK